MRTGMFEATNPSLPDRYYMVLEGLDVDLARDLADDAQRIAKESAPKLTGNSSKEIQGFYGEGFFGLYFPAVMFYQDTGINPFTMKSLAGKTIPMWIDDPDGTEAQKNPKAEKRTLNGRNQILIFRKAAPIGSRKKVVRDGQLMDVPRSYPGAPGRINRREPAGSLRRGSRVGGRIARHNVGVRWRHPGLNRRGFLREAMEQACERANVIPGAVRDSWGRFR